jgi:outer membrane protein assembly factor BamD (BamD/ComL family)
MDISSSSFLQRIFKRSTFFDFCFNWKLSALLLFGCGNPLDKPIKTQEQISEIVLNAKSSIDSKNYNKAIRFLEKLNNECFRDSNLDSEVTLMIANCCYQLPKKKQNLARGISACDVLIKNYPDFAIKNDVYLLKIKLYFDSLDQTATKSVESTQKIISIIDEYSERCQSDKNYVKLFQKNKHEVEKIRLKCLELEVKKRLEIGKAYLEEGQLFPALDSLTETIQASKESKIGAKFAAQAAKLILGLNEILSSNSDKSNDPSGKEIKTRNSFFSEDEKHYWKQEAGLSQDFL